ncbi:MAG: FHA domain-containing protein [Planctomycetes bacterium]|nr:FHA domain-containing protein [Planctomycetota bacterium]
MTTHGGQDTTAGDNGVHKAPRLPKSAPRVRLTILSGPGKGQSLELTRCVSILGSRRGCKLQLKSPDISAVHCAIVNTTEDVYLRDLVSGTGTFLNDLKAQVEKLEDGDTIRLADWDLRVHISAYTLDTLSDLPHVSLEPGADAVGVELNGSGEMVRIQRPVGLVGRREGCDVLVKDSKISRAHMLLFNYSGQPVFFDLLSNNGVTMDGERMHFGNLHSGDRLMLGSVALRMILPGVGRRQQGSSTGSKGSGAGKNGTPRSASPVVPTPSSPPPPNASFASNGGTGTVIQPLDDDGSDRIDIRAAEIDR